MNSESLHQFSTLTVILLMLAFYGGTYLLTLSIRKKKEDADAFMVSNHRVGFGIGAASMTATWIWAASFYAAATSGYTYGVSGPIHYGLWGALMILFIYPFGRRFRKLAPNAHTLGELIHARHGASSQWILALSNFCLLYQSEAPYQCGGVERCGRWNMQKTNQKDKTDSR